MTRLDDLDRAVVLRDRLKALDVFLDGLAPSQPPPGDAKGWGGLVHLQFGSYECEIPGPALVGAVRIERESVVGELALLQVSTSLAEPAPRAPSFSGPLPAAAAFRGTIVEWSDALPVAGMQGTRAVKVRFMDAFGVENDLWMPLLGQTP